MGWLEKYREDTIEVIDEPFLRCLAEAIAAVESSWGRQAIEQDGMLNEIGYKAISGKPSTRRRTQEAEGGRLVSQDAAFRLFQDRHEQAKALLYLMRSSTFYEAARLAFVLAFYAGYAPGRTQGAKDLVKVFSQIAESGAHQGVRPFLITRPGCAESIWDLNHDAFRCAAELFVALTRDTRGNQDGKGDGNKTA